MYVRIRYIKSRRRIKLSKFPTPKVHLTCKFTNHSIRHLNKTPSNIIIRVRPTTWGSLKIESWNPCRVAFGERRVFNGRGCLCRKKKKIIIKFCPTTFCSHKVIRFVMWFMTELKHLMFGRLVNEERWGWLFQYRTGNNSFSEFVSHCRSWRNVRRDL